MAMTDEERANLPRVRKRKLQLKAEIMEIRNEVAEVEAELEALYYVDETSKNRNRILLTGRKKFNQDPWKGLDYLAEKGFVARDPKTFAQWMYKGDGLSKTSIGDVLGSNDPFALETLEEFTKCHDFTNMFIVDALRSFLWSFRLPGEAQKIDRIIEKFAIHYVSQNENVVATADACHTVAYSCIMLNTLLHNPNVKDRPTFERYVNMNKELLEANAVSMQTLQAIYDSIKSSEFKIPQDDTGSISDILLHAEREGWLYKQSSGQFLSGALSWKRRWFVLSDTCLYYFEQTTDKEPRGIIPLRNVGIRRVEQASRPHMFEIYSLSDERIKACKTEQDGRMVEGRHSVYRMCAMRYTLKSIEWLNGVELFEDKKINEEVEDVELQGVATTDESLALMLEWKMRVSEDSEKCTTCECDIDFGDRVALVEHYQSAWHRTNVRRKARNLNVLSEEEFEGMDENETFQDTKNQKIENEESSDEEDIDLCMLPAGRSFFIQNNNVFSVANDRLLAHRSFHRYVARAKQGGVQSQYDNSQGNAKSAGAGLRRYNEQKMKEEIHHLLSSWKEHIVKSPLIFLRCASYQKSIFLDSDAGIFRGDPRLRTIPFETKRPTVDEVSNTWNRLQIVEEHGSLEQFREEMKELNEKRKRVVQRVERKKKNENWIGEWDKNQRNKEEKKNDENQDIRKKDHIKIRPAEPKIVDPWPALSEEWRKIIYQLVRTDNVDGLKVKIEEINEENREQAKEYLRTVRFPPENFSLLHICASKELPKVLSYLLTEVSCDPSCKDKSGKPPYSLSANKQIKEVFIQFRADNPDKFTWSRTHIPEPPKKMVLTIEEQERLAEKKREKKLKQKEKIKQKKDEAAREEAIRKECEKWLNMSEREKRAEIAERRLAGLPPITRCHQCGKMRTSIQRLSSIGVPRRMRLSQYDATQVQYMKEACIRVDELDNVIMPVSKEEAHSSQHLVLHRAFSVFSFTKQNKLLLQKRSPQKITFPNLWTNTCCSHPLHNDSEINGVIGAKKAAVRKLKHELGVEGVDANEFFLKGRYIYRAEMSDAPWGEHELDYALLLKGIGANNCNINYNEVSDVKEVELEELQEWIKKEPQSFTPWMRMIKYHVSRSARLWAFWSNLPANMLKKYPEQTIFYATFGVATLFIGAYKFKKYLNDSDKPYYRGYYDVVRPNDPIALNWRKPEEYPAPYLLSSVETAH
ncbi:unnamed protein product [Caenorhabditis bovis]|uniref:isopentenyl-diphosphate Delta-isomerase n=1 Tax=Caenorhabditis bovis TaxID=2654633 RepID=A0A8S1ERU4_9PELO|nr:unnamed protein product [Caenorhabditis bovis]